MEIIKFLSIEEIFSLKYFCKRFFEIAILSKKLNHYRIICHKFFKIDEFYNNFMLLFDELLNEI